MSIRYHVTKLDKELRSAGIPIISVNSEGVITFHESATLQQRETGIQIVSRHNPDWYVEKRVAAYGTFGDQLDMIYKDKINGTNTWINHITNVKTMYPKN